MYSNYGKNYTKLRESPLKSFVRLILADILAIGNSQYEAIITIRDRTHNYSGYLLRLPPTSINLN